MKKIILLFFVLVALFLMTLLERNNPIENVSLPLAISEGQNGTYLGVGNGFSGPIEIKIYVTKSEKTNINIINDIEIIRNEEIEKYWNEVETILIKKIIEYQSTEVDVVTGATQSSHGLIEAVKEAYEKSIHSYK